MLLVLTVLTGVVYPLVVTGVGQGLFGERASGSPILRDGRVVAHEPIGQAFESDGLFHSRPSACEVPYDGLKSSASQLAIAEPAAARGTGPDASSIPVDLVTASGSGLDPHISPAAALWQVPRVARARGLEEQRVRELVLKHVEGRTFGILGAPRVNVVRLNLALDGLR
jgi:K+-transporting ATPase ATPase C chain